MDHIIQYTVGLTIDPLALGTSQECHDPANIFWNATPLQRACQSSLNLFNRRRLITARCISPGVFEPHITLDPAGCDCINRAALVPKVAGEAARETLDGSLATGVKCVAGHPDAGGDGRHQDDAPTLFDVLVRSLGHKELGAGVEVKDLVEVLQGGFAQRCKFLGAGVGHHDVDAAKLGDNLSEELVDLFDLGHVRFKCGPAGADLLYGLHDVVG